MRRAAAFGGAGVRRAAALGAALALLVGAWACGGIAPHIAPEGESSVRVAPETALALRRRLEGFYLRLAHRRFDTLETYGDAIMRDHFQSPDLFFDYYADLAQALGGAHFDKSRPERVEVLEFVFDAPDRARVLVRFRGFDGRPLRPGRRVLVRTDRWERVAGTWWIRPGRI